MICSPELACPFIAQGCHQQVAIVVSIGCSAKKTNKICEGFARTDIGFTVLEGGSYSNVMPTSEVIILESPVVCPALFVVVFIVAVSAEYSKFISSE